MEREKEELSTLIEKLYSQWEQAPSEDKPFLSEQVQKYALQYKEVTGDWYFRDSKHL